MKRSIVYFSRTGISKEIASDLAIKLKCKVVELQDNMKWSGIFGYIKGGFYASKDKSVEIIFDESCLESDEFIVVSPLWAGGPAPAARAFIRKVGTDKVSLILTNDGSKIENAFTKVDIILPGINKKYGITKKLGNKESVVKSLVEELSDQRIAGL